MVGRASGHRFAAGGIARQASGLEVIMGRGFFLALSVGSVIGVNAASAQARDSVPPRIGATGQQTVRLAPSHAILHILIEAAAPTGAEASARGGQSAAAVRDTLQRTGGASELALVPYGVLPTPPSAYGGGPAGPPNTFTSRSAIRLVARTEDLPALTAAAFAKGASGVAAPVFESSALASATNAAIEQATAQAREHAEAIARGLGGRLGRLVSLSVPSIFQPDYGTVAHFPVNQTYDPQTRPLPEIRVTVSVTGTWVFVPRL
jgi:uncharacterized protein YggE